MERLPRTALRPLVRRLWTAATPPSALAAREHTLPSSDMHLVVRPAGEDIRLVGLDATTVSVGAAAVGGVRTEFYVKEVPQQVHSIGITFHPAAALALFGHNADALAGQHHRLEQLWRPADVAELQERLHETRDAGVQLDILEQVIARRLPVLPGLHPAVAVTLEQLRLTTNITAAVRASGYSHRTVTERFRGAMGVGLKAYLQMCRMRWLLERIGTASWSDLAAQAGFSDQAHFVREFRRFTGTTPTAYLRSRPRNPFHFRILQDSTSATR